MNSYAFEAKDHAAGLRMLQPNALQELHAEAKAMDAAAAAAGRPGIKRYVLANVERELARRGLVPDGRLAKIGEW